MLPSAGARIDEIEHLEYTLLMTVCHLRRDEIVHRQVDRGADIQLTHYFQPLSFEMYDYW
jgi:hypothetical protein